MWYAIYIAGIVVIGLVAFLIGKKLSATPRTESKTTTFLIKSIQAIAELAILEYITEGVTEIREEDQPYYRSLEKRLVKIYG